jgi:hypothetical protein
VLYDISLRDLEELYTVGGQKSTRVGYFTPKHVDVQLRP